MAPKKGSKRVVKDRPKINFEQFSVGRATTEAMVEHKPVRGQRDPEQVQIDNIVQEAWKTWIADGKPTDWLKQPGTTVTLPAEQYETFTWRLGLAGTHYDLKVRIGQVEYFNVYAEDDEAGEGPFERFAEVVFVVTDKPSRNESANDADADSEEAQGNDPGDSPDS